VVERLGAEPVRVPVPQERGRVDPTGVGDGFRAGFLAGLAWGLDAERGAQVGCLLATFVLETVGTQEYRFTSDEFVGRFAVAYGDHPAAEVADHFVTTD